MGANEGRPGCRALALGCGRQMTTHRLFNSLNFLTIRAIVRWFDGQSWALMTCAAAPSDEPFGEVDNAPNAEIQLKDIQQAEESAIRRHHAVDNGSSSPCWAVAGAH